LKKAFKISDLILTGLIGLFSITLLILLPFDTIEFYKNPEDYIKVYELDPSRNFWRLEYLGKTILFFIASIFVVILIGLNLKRKDDRKIILIRRIVVYTFTVLIIINLYLWYLTGFDH
jgi:hypothetical protein